MTDGCPNGQCDHDYLRHDWSGSGECYEAGCVCNTNKEINMDVQVVEAVSLKPGDKVLVTVDSDGYWGTDHSDRAIVLQERLQQRFPEVEFTFAFDINVMKVGS